jgi:multiple sugar transport system permease protein
MRTPVRHGWHKYFNIVSVSTTGTLVFVLVPLLWLLLSSFKSDAQIDTNQILPLPPTLTQYHDAFSSGDFGRYIINSVVVSLGSTFLVLVLGTMAGYALGRLPMRGKLPIMVILLMISVFPAIAVIAPLYLLMRDLHWLNSYQALIVPYTAFNLPFAIWILRNFMLGIPKEMEETGRIDGAGPLRTLWTIVLPQATPGLFTAGIFCFTACWTEFLMALSFESDNQWRTIPVGVALFSGPFSTPYGEMFAGALVASVPIGILTFIFRKSVVSGLTSGAVKG